jgi:hypothetical protein
MPCSQCRRPAFYEVGDQKVPLCLDCWHKFQHGNFLQFLQNTAMMNRAMDDMDEITGFGPTGGRIPVAALARAMSKNSTYNNINILNSTVGVVNTGDLAKIDAVITLTKDSDVEGIGTAIKTLAQAIVDSNEINKTDKQELIDLVQAIGEQIVGQRKKPILFSLFKGLEERAKGYVAISGAVQSLILIATKVLGT